MRNAMYNFLIRGTTLICYRTCLAYVSPSSRILDVGIGNGAMMEELHDVIRQKNLSITGIDVDRCYIEHCARQIVKNGLQEHVRVLYMPVERFEPPQGSLFDYILFSMSFMLLDDPESVLDRVRAWLRPGGRILFFQTMFRRPSPLVDLVKPRLRYLTTVEFGRPVYHGEFHDLLVRKGMQVDEDHLVSRTWLGGEYRFLAVAVDGPAGEEHGGVFLSPHASRRGLSLPRRTAASVTAGGKRLFGGLRNRRRRNDHLRT